MPLSTLKKLGDALHLPQQGPEEEDCFIPSMNPVSAGNKSPSLSVYFCSTLCLCNFEHVFEARKLSKERIMSVLGSTV